MSLKAVIYRGEVRSGADSPDGETPDIIVLTKETNCLLVWRVSFDVFDVLKTFPLYRESEAIEYAVKTAEMLRSKKGDHAKKDR